MMTLAMAEAIVVAAREEARRQAAPPISIVVTDIGGVIKAAIREDGVNLFGIELALAKAKTSLGFGKPTLDMALAPNHEAARAAMLSGATGGGFLAIGGGVPLFDGDGYCVGAAAASGAPHEIDHAIIVAAVRANGFSTIATPAGARL